MEYNSSEQKRILLEYIMLLILGFGKRDTSILLIQKQFFLLTNFDEDLKELYHFIKHYKGPYLDSINDAVRNPFYLENCWEFIPPKKSDRLSGGYLTITQKGIKEFKSFIGALKSEDLDKLHIVNAIQILDKIYNKFSSEELLLLIYVEYPEFTQKSNVYSDLFDKKTNIAEKLFRGNLIDKQKYEELLRFSE